MNKAPNGLRGAPLVALACGLFLPACGDAGSKEACPGGVCSGPDGGGGAGSKVACPDGVCSEGDGGGSAGLQGTCSTGVCSGAEGGDSGADLGVPSTCGADSQGTCVKDSRVVCKAAATGSSGAVQAPVLRMTLDGSWDENWFASAAVADIDNDGKNEIVAARHSVLSVWNADGSLKWRTAWAHSASDSPEHGDSRMWASPVVGNFNADPYLEIAVGSDADSASGVNVAVYDYRGQLMPGWPQKFGDGAYEVRSITAGDLDNDGTAEIVVSKTGESSSGPLTHVYQLDGKPRPGWPQINHATCDPPAPAEPCWEAGAYNQNIGVGDVDRDGYLDVISTYDAIGFGVFDRNGKPFPTSPDYRADRVVTSCEAYEDYELAKQGWGTGDRTEFTYSPPIIADINLDGKMDYVLVGDHEHTQSTANRGVTFWVLNSDMTRPPGWERPKDSEMPLAYGDLGANIVATRPSPSVGNIDTDPGLEIIAPGYDGYLYAFGPTGAMLWRFQFATVATPYTGASEALIADLNGDGVPEILFNTFSSGQPGKPETQAYLMILDNHGSLLHKVPSSGRGSMAPPTVADLDGKGSLVVIISLKDSLGSGKGGVQIWDVPGSSTNCLIWPTGRGNPMRQGWVKPSSG